MPAKGFDPTKFDSFVDRLSPDAIVPEVYVVEKVVDMRIRSGEVEYRVKWRGWPSSTNTWEPKAHLTDYGASESVAEWHAANPDRPDPHSLGHAIMLIQQKSDDEQAAPSPDESTSDDEQEQPTDMALAAMAAMGLPQNRSRQWYIGIRRANA